MKRIVRWIVVVVIAVGIFGIPSVAQGQKAKVVCSASPCWVKPASKTHTVHHRAKTNPTVWPTIAKVYMLATPEQAAYPGNEWMKPCGWDGPTDGSTGCIDTGNPCASKRYVSKRLQGSDG